MIKKHQTKPAEQIFQRTPDQYTKQRKYEKWGKNEKASEN